MTAKDILERELKGKRLRFLACNGNHTEGVCVQIFVDAGIDDGCWFVYELETPNGERTLFADYESEAPFEILD